MKYSPTERWMAKFSPLHKAAHRLQERAYRSRARGKISAAECERRVDAQRSVLSSLWGPT